MPVVLKLDQGKCSSKVRLRIQYDSMEQLSHAVRAVLPMLLSQGKFLAKQHTLALGFEIMESDNQHKIFKALAEGQSAEGRVEYEED